VEYLNSLYDKYHTKNGINFVSVYILEAHADDEWPIRSKKELRIKQHTTIQARAKAAQFMQEYTGWKLPLYLDNMENSFCDRFHAWPLRVFALNKKGELVWMMQPEPDNGLFNFQQIEEQIKMAAEQQKDNENCIIL